MTARTEHALLLTGFYVCMFVLCLVFLVAFSGCAPTRYHSKHSLDGWSIVYADPITIQEVCGYAWGCANYWTQIIYCEYKDHDTCGHEVEHITHGSWHK